jgi:hypothetical protein
VLAVFSIECVPFQNVSRVWFIKALQRNPGLAKRLDTNSQLSLEIVTLRSICAKLVTRSMTSANVYQAFPVKSEKSNRSLLTL